MKTELGVWAANESGSCGPRPGFALDKRGAPSAGWKRLALAVSLGAVSMIATHGRAEANNGPAQPPTKGTVMTSQANGTFEVKVLPLAADEKVKGLVVGRMSIDKQWKGDLEGTSVGEMMTTGSEAVKGSGAYIAIEQVTGSIKGRKGAFTLVHQATMRQNADFNMSIKVVPDSATGDLAGLAGNLLIIIEGGKHSYRFDYTLPEKP
jgi:hypothetical protein